MVSSMARILSSGGVHVSLPAVSATERVDMTLDMTLAVAEAINPDKPNQTEKRINNFHKTPRLLFKVESEPPAKVLWQCWLYLSIPQI